MQQSAASNALAKQDPKLVMETGFSGYRRMRSCLTMAMKGFCEHCTRLFPQQNFLLYSLSYLQREIEAHTKHERTERVTNEKDAHARFIRAAFSSTIYN
jgi:hypothetical protein